MGPEEECTNETSEESLQLKQFSFQRNKDSLEKTDDELLNRNTAHLVCDGFIPSMVPFQAIFRSFYILWNKDIILKQAEV